MNIYVVVQDDCPDGEVPGYRCNLVGNIITTLLMKLGVKPKSRTQNGGESTVPSLSPLKT